VHGPSRIFRGSVISILDRSSTVSLKLFYYKSSYWGGISQAIEVIAAISALGAIGGLPALLSVVAKWVRYVMRPSPGMCLASVCLSSDRNGYHVATTHSLRRLSG